jgi:cysteine desulfurase
VLKTVYLDHNATTPIHADVKSQVGSWMEAWGNPSSIHIAGRGPKTLLREARQNLASFLGVEPLELIFTGGGSEANNLALKGICERGALTARDRNQIIISSIEHPSVTKTAEYLRTRGFVVDRVPVNREGELDLKVLEELLSARTAIVSIMLANNETGNIMPVKRAAEMAHAAGALIHCDAVQGLGKISFNLRDLGVDLASLSGHKFYALKGCGVLFARKGLTLTSLIHGGGQERGRRAGTENILGIASLGYMVASKGGQIAAESERLRGLRDGLERRILAEISGARVTGARGDRLPNTSSLILDGVDGETLLMNMDVRGFAVSTGAACSAGNPEPSPTLLAMGLSREEAQSSLRLSLGWETTPEEVEAFVETLKTVVERLRGFKHGEQFAYGL